MAVVLRDPLVVDNIQEVDVTEATGYDRARELYEDGNLVILRGQRFELDYAFLDSLDFDIDGPPEIIRKLKKYSGEKIIAINPAKPNEVDRFLIGEIFHGDLAKLAYYQAQIRSGNAQSDALYARIFPRYVAHRTVYTWRFTETMFENLHWDNFHIPERFHQVRIFLNVAKAPRLWRLSHRIEDHAETIYRDLRLERFAGELGDEMNVFVNRAIGGMETPCLDRLPKHHVAFAQGDVWLCETRVVAHQIYHGHKAFAAMYFSDPATMDDPGMAFDARIERLHDRHLAAVS